MPQINLKEKIIEHAEGVFRQQGFDGASVQDITDAAGVPKGSFYNHFSSKQALAAEVLHRYALKRLSGGFAGDEPPLERIMGHLTYLIECTEQTGIEYGCLFGTFAAEVATAGDKVRTEANGILVSWTASLAAVIAEAQAAGEVSSTQSAQELATFVIDAFEGTALRVKVTGDYGIFTRFLQTIRSFLTAAQAC